MNRPIPVSKKLKGALLIAVALILFALVPEALQVSTTDAASNEAAPGNPCVTRPITVVRGLATGYTSADRPVGTGDPVYASTYRNTANGAVTAQGSYSSGANDSMWAVTDSALYRTGWPNGYPNMAYYRDQYVNIADLQNTAAAASSSNRPQMEAYNIFNPPYGDPGPNYTRWRWCWQYGYSAIGIESTYTANLQTNGPPSWNWSYIGAGCNLVGWQSNYKSYVYRSSGDCATNAAAITYQPLYASTQTHNRVSQGWNNTWSMWRSCNNVHSSSYPLYGATGSVASANWQTAKAASRRPFGNCTPYSSNEETDPNWANFGSRRRNIFVDTVAPPAPTVTSNAAGAASAWAHPGGNTSVNNPLAWLRPNAGGGIIVTAAHADPVSATSSGAENFSWAAVSGGTNWTGNTGGATTTDTTRSLTPGAGATNLSYDFDSNDYAGNDGVNRNVYLTIDTTPPAFSSWTQPAASHSPITTSTYTFTWGAAATDTRDGTNTGSGYGGSHRVFQTAALSSPGVCGSSWSNVTDLGNSTATSYVASGMTDGKCYRMAVRHFDNVGNYTGWSYGRSVLVDLNSPTASFAALPAYDNDGQVNVVFTTADSASGIASWSLNRQRANISAGACSTTWSTTATGIDTGAGAVTNRAFNDTGPSNGYCYRWQLVATDAVGRSVTQYSTSVLTDTIPPDPIVYTNPTEALWYNGTSFTWNWTDGAGMTNQYTSLLTRNLLTDPTCTSAGSSSANVLTTGQSRNSPVAHGSCYQLGVYGTDTAGNRSPASGYYYSDRVMVDQVDPVSNATIISGTGGLNGWFTTPVTVGISSTDDLSGFDTTTAGLGVLKYIINGGSVTTCDFATCGQGDGSLALNIDLSADDIYSINYWATDQAGNEEGPRTLTVKIDASPPTGCMITAVDETTETTVDVTVSGCSDPGGLDGARFGDEVGYNWNNAFANIGWVDYTGGTITRSVTLASGSGDYKILVQIRDLAGNMAFLDTQTTLNTAVNYPVLGAGAYIYECGSNADPDTRPDNETGTVYWTVDRSLCLVPHLTQITPGTRAGSGAAETFSSVMTELAPEHYWRLGESSGTTAIDVVGAADGAYSGPTQGVGGLVGDGDGAASFDGVDDYVATSAFTVAAEHTISAWVNRDTDALGYIASSGTTNGYLRTNTSGRVQFVWRDSTGVGRTLSSPNNALPTGGAHFVVGTHDGTTARLYIDGVQVASDATYDVQAKAAFAWQFGRLDSTNAGPFDGIIDEVAIFDRAISAGEVTRLFNAGPNTGSAPTTYANTAASVQDLVAYWNLDEASGVTVSDSAGSANGSLSGGTQTGADSLIPNSSGHSASFDGVDGRISAPNVPALGGAWSIGAIIERETDDDKIFLSGGLPYLRAYGSERVYLSWYDTSGTQRGLMSPVGTVPVGETSHVIGTHDGTTARIYVDGVEVASTSSWPTQTVASSTWYIGGHNSSGWFFTGRIDEVTLHAGALSASEVADLYDNSTNGGGPGLTSRVIDPLISYTVLPNPNDTARSGMTYPSALVGEDREAPPADAPLQFAFTRETSGMEQALPVLIVPVQIRAEIGWFNSEDVQIGPSEEVINRVELRIIVRNTGRSSGP